MIYQNQYLIPGGIIEISVTITILRNETVVILTMYYLTCLFGWYISCRRIINYRNEFEQTQGDSEGQGCLCAAVKGGHKALDMT